MTAQYRPWRANFCCFLHAKMCVYILKQFCDIHKSSFAFTVHHGTCNIMPDCLHGFCRLRTLHVSRTWIDAAPKNWKVAHKPRLYGVCIGMVFLCECMRLFARVCMHPFNFCRHILFIVDTIRTIAEIMPGLYYPDSTSFPPVVPGFATLSCFTNTLWYCKRRNFRRRKFRTFLSKTFRSGI